MLLGNILQLWFIITARKRSLGQGNVLYLSVSHSVHRRVSASESRGCTPPRTHTLDTHTLDTHTWTHTHTHTQTPGHTRPGHPPNGHPLDTHPGHPVEMATEAGGTHPTGMHSCLKMILFVAHI